MCLMAHLLNCKLYVKMILWMYRSCLPWRFSECEPQEHKCLTLSWCTIQQYSEMASGQYGHSLCHPTNHTDPLFPPLSFPLSHSLPVSLCMPQQAGQMAAPRPGVPGKACELKVIPSRFEELPTPSLRSRGGPRPTCLPGSGTSGWGFVEWWACCRQPPQPAPRRKEKPSSVQFFS